MAGWNGRRRAVWRDHYGPLAGWLYAVTGDAHVAGAIAEEAFVRAFSRWNLPRHPRRVLYARAMYGLERRHGAAAWEVAPDGWLGGLVRGLPKVSRRAVLLHRAGLSHREIAALLNLRSKASVARLLATAERAEPTVVNLRLPQPRAGDRLSREPAGERAASAS